MNIELAKSVRDKLIKDLYDMSPGDKGMLIQAKAIDSLTKAIDEAEKLEIEKAHNAVQDKLAEKESELNAQKVANDTYRIEVDKNHYTIQDDLAEEELKVNAKRNQNDFIKTCADFGSKILLLFGGGFITWISYQNEAIKFNLPVSKGALDMGKKFIDWVKR